MRDVRGLDPALDLRLGGRHASISLHDLATASGIPVARLRGILLSLLLTSRARAGAGSPCPAPVPTTEGEGEATEGESESGRSERSPTFPNENKTPRPFGTSGTSGPERSDARGSDGDHPVLARRLALSLDDAPNLAAFERAVRRHPEALVLRALDLTLRVPRGHIRKSPGAYFTGVLAALTRNPPPSHDRTPSSPP